MNIAQLEAKLSQNPASPLFARLAEEYLAAGKVQEARTLCLSGLQQFPDYPTAYLILANCDEAEGDYQSALDSLSIALDYFPFAPRLLDLHVGLSSKLAPSAGIEEAHAPQVDENAVETIAPQLDVTALPLGELTDLLTEPTIAEANPGVAEETTTDVSGEIPASGGMMRVTPLEDELRRSLEEHLEQVLGEESIDELPGETPMHTDEVPASIASEEEIQTEEAELPEALQDSSTTKDAEESASQQQDEAAEKPAEIEQFFNERILELQVEPLPEVEPPPAVSEPPAVEAPSVEEAAPVVDEKPAYVPPPPIPEETDVLDETTSLGVDGRIVSRTLAEIYVLQGAIAEAILTYQLLKLEKPHLRAECEARIRELEPKLQDKPSI